MGPLGMLAEVAKWGGEAVTEMPETGEQRLVKEVVETDWFSYWWLNWGLKKPELNVVLFIPSQFKQRFNALRNEDYRLRRLTNPLHKTRIEFSDDDLILYACPIGHYRFDQYVVHGLPAVDLAPVRTPPPGRKTKRPRSDSTTPEAAVKKKERVISPKHSNEDTDKTEDEKSGDVNEAESLNWGVPTKSSYLALEMFFINF